MKATWLGQAGFRVELDGRAASSIRGQVRTSSGSRPPPQALIAEGVDWVLVTHEHLDHLDPPVLRLALERSPTARVVVPGSIARLLAEIVPADRVVAVQPGDVLDLGGVDCRVVPAIHGVTMEDAYGDGSVLGEGPRFVGYVLGGGRRLYHAGDTIVTEPCERHSTRSTSTWRSSRSTAGTPSARRAASSATWTPPRRSTSQSRSARRPWCRTTGTASRGTRLRRVPPRTWPTAPPRRRPGPLPGARAP